MNDKKTKSMLLLGLLLLGITIGYAILSSNLNINGTSIINKPTWDIHFENIQVKSGSVTPSTAANITNATTVTYSVSFDTPGQFYEFNVDVKNAGSIDGMIESVTSTVNGQPISSLPSYVEYYVTYSDGVEIQNNHLLTAGSKETYTVHIGFRKDIDLDDLPDIATTYNLSFNFIDTQADSNASSVTHSYTGTIYRWGEEPIAPGDNIGTFDAWCIIENYEDGTSYNSCENSNNILGVDYFNSKEDCEANISDISDDDGFTVSCQLRKTQINFEYIKEEDYPSVSSRVTALGHNYYIKHDVVNDLVTTGYVCVAYNNTEECFQGWIDEAIYDEPTGQILPSAPEDAPVFMRNAQLLMNYKSFFGLSDDNCDSCPNEFIVCSCHGGNIRTINFDYPGVVEIGDEAYFCNIGFSGDDRYILYSKCDRWD